MISIIPGLKIINTPVKPIISARILIIYIFSFNINTLKITTRIGLKKPIALTNYLPTSTLYLRKTDLFIPRLLKYKNTSLLGDKKYKKRKTIKFKKIDQNF